MQQSAVLLTGFEPYGGRGINPSAEVVRRLNGTVIDATPVVGRTLPVSFRSLPDRIVALLAEVKPVAVISMGLWPGEPVIRLERVAFNLAAFEIPDNEGILVEDAALVPDAASAIPARLPLRDIEAALLQAGIPARLSSSAGTFLCNATLYTFLMESQRNYPNVPCGFVHLPYLPEQVAEILDHTRREHVLELHQRADLSSMSLDVMVRAVRITLEMVVRLAAVRAKAGARGSSAD